MRTALFAAVLLSACAASTPNLTDAQLSSDTANSKLVAVGMSGGKLTCSPDPVKARKNVHRVVWVGSSEMSISLDHGYGNADCKRIGNDDSRWRCTAGPFPHENEHIKYTVRMGGAELDPLIDVEP